MREVAGGRILHTGQAIADIVMNVDAIPEPGGDTYATRTQITAGGGFNVMAAAARDGGHVIYLGSIGQGPFAEIVTKALIGERIQVPAQPVQGMDTGYCVALVDNTAERTFISALGAEGHCGIDHLRAVDPAADDIVYVTGYSFLHETNRAALLEWIPQLPEQTRIIFDASPLIDQIPDPAFSLMASRAWMWSLNSREARLVLHRLGITDDPIESEVVVGTLVDALQQKVLLRCGSDGALFGEPGGGVVHVPSPVVAAIDTNGAGDAHTGVLMAHLARGGDLVDGIRRANVAAAIAVTREGPATSPTGEEIDAALG